jgi:hypothetical protein
VPPSADDPRKVHALVDPAGVGRDPAVTGEQHAGGALGERLAFLGRFVDRPLGLETDMAVRVNETRDDPAFGDGLEFRGALVGDPAVDQPQLDLLPLGQGGPMDVQCNHESILPYSSSTGRARKRP